MSRLEEFHDLRRGPAQQFHFQPVEQPDELGQMRRQQLQIDRTRQGELERSDLATLDGGRQGARAERTLVALLQERMHALPKLRQLSLRAFAAKQVAAELVLELLDGAGERRLRHVALFGGLGEIELADGRQEISDLMHFHGRALSTH